MVYAEQVLTGQTPACRWVRLACERQFADMDREAKGWEFHRDEKQANRVCQFVELLPHVRGRWKSKTLILEPWQCFLFSVLFGWVGDDGFRRFRQAYVEVPARNSKSTLAAATGLYMLGPDGEPGAEVYSTATTRDQAKVCWEVARLMVKRTPAFREAFGIEPLQHAITIAADGRTFRPLSRDADSLEGLNAHCAIIDELHAHKTREVHDVIVNRTGSRRQPLVFKITTAGDNLAGVCYEQREYACNILAGRHADERTFGIIYGLDPEDDWTSPDSWRKANPNYGVSVLAEDIEALANQAMASAESQANFQTKRLNMWISGGTCYFNMLAWEQRCRAPIVEAEFEGAECLFGLDLASKNDVAALIKLFRKGKKYAVFGRFWIPESSIEKGRPNYDFYRGWVRDGYMTTTPGNVIDFEFIEQEIQDSCRRFHPKEVCYDPYQATELSTRMRGAGVPMVEYGQTVKNFSEPMKTLAALILSGNVQHDGNPVLSWMVANTQAKMDVKENVFPRKARPENKIDGAVATIQALGRMIVLGGTSTESVYGGMAVV